MGLSLCLCLSFCAFLYIYKYICVCVFHLPFKCTLYFIDSSDTKEGMVEKLYMATDGFQ